MIEDHKDTDKYSAEVKGRSIMSGLLWKAAENGGDQLITFLVSLVLARLLGPERYGTLSLMLVFITISNVIIQSGFQTSLIQKKDITAEDLSSVFWTGLGISALLYILLFALAPEAAEYFGDPEIAPMLRVLSLILFFGSVISVEMAIIARRMEFRIQCAATMAADVISGAAGIFAALRGLGTWALVWQQFFKYLMLMVLLLLLVRWRPRACISLNSLRSLFSFGWKVLVSGLIDTIYNNIYTPVIQKLFSSAAVGFYNRGNQFPQIIANSVGQTMQAVMLPAFSRLQDERERLRDMLGRTIGISCYIMFPMMAGLMAVADPLIRLLLGESWMPAAPMLRLCCLSYAAWPMHVANLQAINAGGRSDIYLRLEIVKKLLGVGVLMITAPHGIACMLIGKAAFDLLCTFINAAPNAGLLGYGPLRQWRDVGPELLLSVLMGIMVYMAGQRLYGAAVLAELPGAVRALTVLVAQVLLGAVIYMGASAFLKLQSFRELMAVLSELGIWKRGRKND